MAWCEVVQVKLAMATSTTNPVPGNTVWFKNELDPQTQTWSIISVITTLDHSPIADHHYPPRKRKSNLTKIITAVPPGSGVPAAKSIRILRRHTKDHMDTEQDISLQV
ncbi:hypothetical protein LB507_001917 [Fusarium sp. FIESC RH6]|nr:hypothetical protein LB507_001917 [Fusarium sp. FIESC RH6]